jgi:hypothetical protein
MNLQARLFLLGSPASLNSGFGTRNCGSPENGISSEACPQLVTDHQIFATIGNLEPPDSGKLGVCESASSRQRRSVFALAVKVG